jgi:hypothetical protein
MRKNPQILSRTLAIFRLAGYINEYLPVHPLSSDQSRPARFGRGNTILDLAADTRINLLSELPGLWRFGGGLVFWFLYCNAVYSRATQQKLSCNSSFFKMDEWQAIACHSSILRIAGQS